MSFLTTCFSVVLAFLVARFLLRHLGFPRDIRGVVRWGIALLLGVVALHALADCLRSAAEVIPRRSFGEADVLEGLLFVALAVGGYFAWNRDRGAREEREVYEARANTLPRRRVLPPPPSGVGGFRPVGAPERRDGE